MSNLMSKTDDYGHVGQTKDSETAPSRGVTRVKIHVANSRFQSLPSHKIVD